MSEATAAADDVLDDVVRLVEFVGGPLAGQVGVTSGTIPAFVLSAAPRTPLSDVEATVTWNPVCEWYEREGATG